MDLPRQASAINLPAVNCSISQPCGDPKVFGTLTSTFTSNCFNTYGSSLSACSSCYCQVWPLIPSGSGSTTNSGSVTTTSLSPTITPNLPSKDPTSVTVTPTPGLIQTLTTKASIPTLTSPENPSNPSASLNSLTSSQSSPAPSLQSKSIGISSGAAAGVGIGCLLAGALIAGLIAFLLFRRKKKTAYSGQHPYGAGYIASDKGGLIAGDSPISGGVASNINRLLPQPAEDAAIIGGLSKIRDDIKNHAQNYYHNDAIQPELVDETEVLELAHAISAPASAVRGLLLNPGTRTDAIRLFLAQLILSSCTGTSDLHLSLLPREISAVTATLSANGTANASQAALFSKWKTISGVLLQREYGGQIRDNDARIENINRVVAIADSVLQPFMDSLLDMVARRRHLEATVRRAAQFAFLLFSQPASFQLDYTGTGRRDNLLVFPALLQTVNDEAEVLSPPRVLSEREVVTGLIF